MYALGNVKVSQGDQKSVQQGYEWHVRAYNHYLDTIGEGHHRAADVSCRLADDHMRAKRYLEAT